MFAVWSDTNGQDDLIWYTADSNGHVVAKYTGSYGNTIFTLTKILMVK